MIFWLPQPPDLSAAGARISVTEKVCTIGRADSCTIQARLKRSQANRCTLCAEMVGKKIYMCMHACCLSVQHSLIGDVWIQQVRLMLLLHQGFKMGRTGL